VTCVTNFMNSGADVCAKGGWISALRLRPGLAQDWVGSLSMISLASCTNLFSRRSASVSLECRMRSFKALTLVWTPANPVH